MKYFIQLKIIFFQLFDLMQISTNFIFGLTHNFFTNFFSKLPANCKICYSCSSTSRTPIKALSSFPPNEAGGGVIPHVTWWISSMSSIVNSYQTRKTAVCTLPWQNDCNCRLCSPAYTSVLGKSLATATPSG